MGWKNKNAADLGERHLVVKFWTKRLTYLFAKTQISISLLLEPNPLIVEPKTCVAYPNSLPIIRSNLTQRSIFLWNSISLWHWFWNKSHIFLLNGSSLWNWMFWKICERPLKDWGSTHSLISTVLLLLFGPGPCSESERCSSK